jgi:hypothetical protein
MHPPKECLMVWISGENVVQTGEALLGNTYPITCIL